ncbi:MAG: recombinase family protein [Urechidicola sp.]|nr:recombinase family protein [Urechidicola sp.]
MKQWAIYIRVSTDEQHTENQKLLLTQYADRLNYSYTVINEVQSTRKTRPLKQQLLNDLRKKKYKGVIVYKFDRWARSSRELIVEIEELLSKGVQFVSYSENIDFSTAIGKLQFNILSAFAEFERDLISQRTKEGLRRTKAAGTVLGRRKGSKDKKKRKTLGYYNNKNATH